MKNKIIRFLVSRLDEKEDATGDVTPITTRRKKKGQIAVYLMGNFSHYVMI